jgi:serine/threonine-protein kinase
MSKPPSNAIRKLMRKAKSRESASGPAADLGDRYEVGEKLGEGGFGAVFRGRDRQSGHPVAIKALHDKVESDVVKERMNREARALRQLAGTCAVGVHDLVVTPSGKLYLIMELLDGQDLKQHMADLEAQGKRPSMAEIEHLLSPVVATLTQAHGLGIVHRDLKPGNIFVQRHGDSTRTRLLDFGLVKDVNLERLTATGVVTGSPVYMAPEAWSGKSQQIDHRADVYALAVILYQLLTGELPFPEADNTFAIIFAARAEERPAITRLRPDLHPSIDDWGRRGLAIEPDGRFQTVQELWYELGRILSLTAGR